MNDSGHGPLQARLQQVLRDNSAGRWTKPSPSQYPHQWNWDSAFISIGLATFDWPRAVAEVESLLESQWREGMVPHVRYDPSHVQDYFPGPDRWPGAQPHVARSGIQTSGITNPPVVASAALLIGRRQPDEGLRHAFWHRVLPPLGAYLRWFMTRRRLGNGLMFASVHPWEGGWDNSPRWDHLAAAGLKPQRPYVRLDTRHVSAGQRPAGRDYDSYLSLVEILDACDYDIERYAERSPFVVNDVVIDALWFRAAVDLAEIAAALGVEAPITAAEMSDFAQEFERVHWDPAAGTYLDFDLVAGSRIEVPTAAGLVALGSGLAPRARASAIWDAYRAGRPVTPVATVPPWSPRFEPGRYWRGPVWICVNWLVAVGLEQSGLRAAAEDLRTVTTALVAEGGPGEYFDPISREALGSAGFSWSAALALDLLAPRGEV